MNDRIPRHVTEVAPGERANDDSLYTVAGFLFPEVREPLWPARTFPVAPHERPADDASPDEELEPLVEFEGAVEAQQLGLQYSIFVQHQRDRAVAVDPPRSWDRHQLLWTDLPVFAEESCEWHYPKLQHGFNIDSVEGPPVLRPDVNTPELCGYMPNGDLIVYWQIAEALAARFDIDVQPIHSSVDGMALVTARGLSEDVLLEAPIGQGVETGILLSEREAKQAAHAVSWIEAKGGTATVFEYASDFMFFKIAVPVVRCEMRMNTYLDFAIDPFDAQGTRLSGYSFRVLDTPATRDLPLFATERGNLVVSDLCFEFLKGSLNKASARNPDAAPGNVLPVIRTP